MKEKVKILNTNEEENRGNDDLSVSPQVSPHRNPNEYNGEVIGNQQLITDFTNKRKVYIVSYGCI
jgi:hypothetical protein